MKRRMASRLFLFKEQYVQLNSGSSELERDDGDGGDAEADDGKEIEKTEITEPWNAIVNISIVRCGWAEEKKKANSHVGSMGLDSLDDDDSLWGRSKKV
uniref:Uncharacterized protein n=1 Tax=Cucumis sativus TaxID=3659 RepID=A0A0A0LDD3_CUCSA